MDIVNCSKADFDNILKQLDQYWEGADLERLSKIRHLHHPMMIYELGDNAYVIKDGSRVKAYLLGLFSKTEPVAYVHFIATHKHHKRRGLARALYHHFMEKAGKNGCTHLKAITTPTNEASIAFHTKIGMRLLGEPNASHVCVVRDYAGPGEDRVVFWKKLGEKITVS